MIESTGAQEIQKTKFLIENWQNKVSEDYPLTNSGEIGKHRLSRMVDPQSPEITHDELDEVEPLIMPYIDNENYEYSGNFIITKSRNDIDSATNEMCCGIVNQEFTLKNGTIIYFAFDYGH
jgi:hypothetical protein